MSTLIEPPVEQTEKNLEKWRRDPSGLPADSGDGMQLTGNAVYEYVAVVGNDISTLPTSLLKFARLRAACPASAGFS